MNLHPDRKTDVWEDERVTMDTTLRVTPSPRARHEPAGLVVDGSNTAAAVKTIVSDEDSGVRQAWMVQLPFWPDPLITLRSQCLHAIRFNVWR